MLYVIQIWPPPGTIPAGPRAADYCLRFKHGSFSVGGLSQSGFNNPSSLVRWAEDGLAFRTDSQVYILHNPVVRDLTATPADVAVSMSVPASSVTGVNTPITVHVKNNGPSTATGVTLTDTFSSDVILVSVNASQGTCGATLPVRCDIGNLTSGATASVGLVVLPALSGTLTNTATVSATQPDSNAGNNTARILDNRRNRPWLQRRSKPLISHTPVCLGRGSYHNTDTERIEFF